MPTTAQIIQLANQFKRQILADDRETITGLTRAYGEIWNRLRIDVRQLTTQIEQARERGETVSEAWLFQNNRLGDLLAQVERELEQFNIALESDIVARQTTTVALAQEQTAALVQESGVRATLTRLPREAINELVATLPNGSPLNTLLKELVGQGSQNMREALINGVAQGWNPRRIEREARAANGQVLQRALTVARTEALRPYREAQYQQRQANQNIIQGWVWLSGAKTGTCASCWAMHGTRHGNNERLNDHPNGRCTEIPIVAGFNLNVPTGDELFKRLPAADQQKILRGEKYEAYRDGRIKLNDLVHRSRSRVWGTTRNEASLAQALAGGK